MIAEEKAFKKNGVKGNRRLGLLLENVSFI